MTQTIEQDTSKDLKCAGCGANNWKYSVTYTTLLDALVNNQLRTQTNEEIRCVSCNKKAMISNEAAIRETDKFKRARQREDEAA